MALISVKACCATLQKRTCAKKLFTVYLQQPYIGDIMKSVVFTSSFLPAAVLMLACGPAAGTQPHDLSVPQHEAAAAQEEQQASGHAEQHDPNATRQSEQCLPGKGRVCWTVASNPTAEHIKSADEHRALAAQHRASSQALSDAETQACAGLAEEDRDTSPFAHVADIHSVSQLKEERPVGKNKENRETGATVVFRAAPGLTEEWLQRIVNCHLARNAAVGHDMAEMPYCPLVPKGVQAGVRSVGDGFAVDIRSEEPGTAAEIWRRAQQLSTTP